MISKILVANRGEIALRIIRSCRELGIKSVAVYSEADRQSLHTLLADERVCIGPAKASESYLNIANILSAAEITGADAIHPGYGFLAENAKFAEICKTHGLVFIGPPPSIIRLMGDKNKARQTMKKAGLPILPGQRHGHRRPDRGQEDRLEDRLPRHHQGRGRGRRQGHAHLPLGVPARGQFPIAQGEAKAAFSDSSLYIEKFVSGARHIEIQVIGDRQGKVTAFGERECSVQRRYQKLIEETPSPFIDWKTRRRMIKEVEDAASEVGYQSLGTFEFLVDEDRKFYFMEANARVQVEHPITEMVYGINLIKAQIRIAAGEKYVPPYSLEMRGHAIECRINAEDPVTFAPSPGKIDFLVLPGRRGHPRRLGGLRRLGRAAELRFAAGQDHRLRPEPGPGHRQDAGGPGDDDRSSASRRTSRSTWTSCPTRTSWPAGTPPSSWTSIWRPRRPKKRKRSDGRPRSERAPDHDDRKTPAVVLEDVLVDAQIEPPFEGDGDRPLRTDQEQDEDLVLDLQPGILVDRAGPRAGRPCR